MVFVSITRLRVRAWRFMPAFFAYALRSASQAKKASGNLSVTLLNDAHRTFWTRSTWESEVAMRVFMVSGAHAKAMPSLMHWCDEAAVVHWTQDSAEPPSWEEAHHKMQDSGRPSKVSNPSQSHKDYRIVPPRVKKSSVDKAK
jgi:heme-degrading monooxygenase HmoA